MNTLKTLGVGVALACVASLVGCGKSEPTPAADSAVPPPAQPPGAMQETVNAAMAEAEKMGEAVKATAAETMANARASLAGLKLPDFQTASTAQLSTLASQTLTQWSQSLASPTPAVTTEVEAVKTALSANQPSAALSSLGKLGEYAKTIPGAEVLLQSSKQLVSAWALKQGFDTAQISGVLGSLQRGDYAGMATQAAALFGKGGVNEEQKGLLEGVLETFGVDAGQAAGAVNAVRGLFGN